MSKAMNRSFANVLFGAFGGGAPAAAVGAGGALPVRCDLAPRTRRSSSPTRSA